MLDEAHKARKAELEKQLAEGSTDPNVKTELEAIKNLEKEGGEDAQGAKPQTTTPATGGAKPAGRGK